MQVMCAPVEQGSVHNQPQSGKNVTDSGLHTLRLKVEIILSSKTAQAGNERWEQIQCDAPSVRTSFAGDGFPALHL